MAMSIQSQQRIDVLCDRFEAAIRADDQPRIEDFLADANEADRPVLLRALLEVELELRLKAGESPSESQYATRFPDDVALIEAAFDWARSRQAKVGDEGETKSLSQQTEDTSIHPLRGTRHPIPERIGRFEILELLGEGGFGRVYRASDPKLKRDVALKVPRQGVLTNEREIDWFHREGQAAANLRHPGICPVYEIGDVDGIHFIVTALIHGHTLAEQLVDRRLSVDEIVRLVHSLAQAVQYAHDRGIVHRDLKPSNVMIDADSGEPVVMDFGLASCSEVGHHSLNQTGLVLGTPTHMSPEQARGDIRDVGPASDIYSLGIILYQLLCGEVPFRGQVMEVLAQIVNADPEPPSQRREGVDERLEHICLKMLAKQPEDRYASIQEVADALADLQEPITDKKPSTALPMAEPKNGGSRPNAWMRHSPRARLAIAAGFGGLVIAAVIMILQTRYGTLRIEISDPNLTVKVDDETITFENKNFSGKKASGKHRLSVVVGDTPITLDGLGTVEIDGQHRKLIVTVDGKRISSDEFEITRRGDTVVRISLSPPAGVAKPAVSGEAIDLIPLVNLDRDHVNGHWKHDGTELSCFFASPYSRIMLPVEVQGSYELDIEFASQGRWNRLVSLPANHGTLLIAIGYSNNSRVRLHLFDGRRCPVLVETPIRSVPLRDNLNRLVCKVETSGKSVSVNVVLNGLTNLKWNGSPDPVELPRGVDAIGSDYSWRLPYQDRPGLGEFFGTTTFFHARIRALAGGEYRIIADQPEPQRAIHPRARLAHSDVTWAVAISPDAKTLATAAGMELKLWDLPSCQPQATLENDARITRLGFAPNTKLLAACGNDGSFSIWDGNRKSKQFIAHKGTIRDLLWSPAGDVVATRGTDDFVRVWNPTDWTECLTPQFGRGEGRLAFTADGRTLAWGNDAGAIFQWNLTQAKPPTAFEDSARHWFGMDYSPDGKTIAGGRVNGVIELKDCNTGKIQGVLTEHFGEPLVLRYLKEGDMIMSGGADGTVMIWDARYYRKLVSWKAQAGPVRDFALSPDNSVLVTVGADQYARVYDFQQIIDTANKQRQWSKDGKAP